MPEEIVPASLPVETRIYTVRGQSVMLDSDLAEVYQVETRGLNKAVDRNPDRFIERFCFRLTPSEWENLMFQIGTSRSWGGRRKLPRVFTEHGAVMKERIGFKVTRSAAERKPSGNISLRSHKNDLGGVMKTLKYPAKFACDLKRLRRSADRQTLLDVDDSAKPPRTKDTKKPPNPQRAQRTTTTFLYSNSRCGSLCSLWVKVVFFVFFV